MNLHLCQSAETTLELEHLCRVSLNIISPEHSSPVIGICQDSLVGGYLLTDDDVLLTRKQFMNLMYRNSNYIYELPKPAGPNGMWTGKQAFSMILPEIDVVYPADKVVIKGGQLLEGQVGKAQLGATKRSLVHILFNDYSPAECLRFLDNEQAITNSWLLNNNGFSVGLSDCILPAEGTQAIKEVIRDKLADAYQMLHKAHEDNLELMYGKAPVEDFELQLTALLNSVRDATKPQDKIKDRKNRFMAMYLAKSKGKKENLAQIMGCLGQQVVSVRQADGTYKQQRIPYNSGKIKGGFEGRTLPHFHKHDDAPAARGFVMHNYLEGLNPFEFFFHNSSGREGLIDTAIKTAATGYLQRKLIKLMEDCKVHYDGTVRNSSKLILQYSYGADNLDCTKLEYDGVSEKLFSMDNITLADGWKLSVAEEWNKLVDAKVRKEIQKDTGLELLLEQEFDKILEGRDLLREEIFKMPVGKHSLMARASDSIATYLPLNMVRLIGRIKRQFRSRKILSDLNPRYIVESVNALVEKLAGVANAKSDYMRQILRRDKVMYDIVFGAHLSAKQILIKHRLTREMFDFLLVAIEVAFQKARVNYGEMVGIIAGQSLGQPTTQMTLNTFHSSGISMEFNVVDGVPRLEELMGASKNPKAPQITIYLKDEFAADEERAGIIRNKLRSTKIRDITKKSEIIYDPSDEDTLMDADIEFMRSYYNFMKDNACSFDTSWVLRIELDRTKMLERNLRMWEVQMRLEEKFGDEIHCVFSDDNHSNLVIRIRLGSDHGDGGEEDDDIVYLLKHFERSIMDGLVLRGVPGVNNAFIPTRASRPCILRVADNGSVLEDNDNREIVIIAEGTNDSGLMEVMKLPEVDKQRTSSNNIYEVYLLLGIEAARNLLMREIFKVFQSGDSYINHRHIEMLVDTMTCRGDLTPISRNGIQKLNVGPLARSSFEETEQQFVNAAAFAEVDTFQGVSSNIMCGQRFPGGTGECDIVLDEDRLFEKLKLPPIAETSARHETDDGQGSAAAAERAAGNNQLQLNFNMAGAASSTTAARFNLESMETVTIS